MQALVINQCGEPELTVSELSQIKGCSEQYIRAQISRGELSAIQRLNSRNRITHYIPLSALDAKTQRRYRKGRGEVLELPTRQSRPLDAYTANEREQIHFWNTLIEEWQAYRRKPIHQNLAAADESFVVYAEVAYQSDYERIFGRAFNLSARTLYRKWESYREKDSDALIEKRGKFIKGASEMPDLIWDAFLYYYLDLRQHPIRKCIEYTEGYLRMDHPELLDSVPHYSSFYRRIQRDIPEPLKVLGREGEKAYEDRCAPYIRRTYDDMESNDYWVADTHTLDVMSQNEDGKTRRLYLTAFFDARSGVFTGYTITEKPGSQAVLNALRKGIQKYGIPKFIYVDNGREFLTHDVGGMGHRKKKVKNPPPFEPPAVFQRLGITIVNAKVRNAKAKVIERRFLDVKNDFSRLFSTFTGGNVLEKPENLERNLKKGKAPTDADLIETAGLLLDCYFNQQEYHGAVKKDHGKTRQQVFWDNLHTQRVAPEEDLNLMMMRSSRVVKVGRRGISHKIGDGRLEYWNDVFVNNMKGQEVYYRFDPDNMSSIRVYTPDDKFIMAVPVDNEAVLAYGCGQEELKIALKKVAQAKKTQKEALKNIGLAAYDEKSALEVVINTAKQNSLSFVPPTIRPVVYQLERATETPILDKAVGLGDIDTMIRNSERYHERRVDE